MNTLYLQETIYISKIALTLIELSAFKKYINETTYRNNEK